MIKKKNVVRVNEQMNFTRQVRENIYQRIKNWGDGGGEWKSLSPF